MMEPPAKVAHHDEARSAVSVTALSVCSLRACESQKPAADRLFFDPFAEVLCGRDFLARNLDWVQATGKSKEFWVDLLAVRTRWIDDAIASSGLPQLVILGSGLDARAYRLESLSGVPVYEVDFPEMVAAKRTLLAAESPRAKLRPVPSNLGIEDWGRGLVAAGFDAGQPTAWLLEGLTGYLTEEELALLLRRVAGLSCRGSRMIATFVGEGMERQATRMHRYFAKGKDDVTRLLREYGWSVDEACHIGDIATLYGRAGNIPSDHPYYLARGTLLAAPAPPPRL